MLKRKHLLILALVLLSLVFSAAAVSARQATSRRFRQATSPAGPEMSSDHFGLDWNVTANGGGSVSSPHFKISSTIGQTAVGITSSSNFEVCSGFWCKVRSIFEIFLPILAKN